MWSAFLYVISQTIRHAVDHARGELAYLMVATTILSPPLQAKEQHGNACRPAFGDSCNSLSFERIQRDINVIEIVIGAEY